MRDPPRPNRFDRNAGAPHGIREDLRTYVERRREIRHCISEQIELVTGNSIGPGVLLDISRTGLTVRLGNGLMPSEYDELSVRLSDGKCLYGVVVWSRQSMLGIAFDTSLPDAEDIVWIENRGPEWWRRAARVWDKRRD